jgi:hypothetical protein
MLCFMVHQPCEDEKPGYEWPGVGTEFNRHVTWWAMGEAWLTYLARCQGLLQAGEFAADVCYFSGEWVPNYIPARWAMNPPLPPGYDCDTVNAEVLCGGKVGEGGLLELAGGMKYRYLVLNQGGRWSPLANMEMFPGTGLTLDTDPGYKDRLAPAAPKPLVVSPTTLAKIKSLIEGGVTLIGLPPTRAIGLSNYPRCDADVERLVAAIWGAERAAAGERRVGQGRVIWGKSLEEIFAVDHLQPDLEIKEDASAAARSDVTLNGIPNPTGSFDWIHRRINEAEVYFIANLRGVDARGEFTFRVANRRPALWDAVTGEIRSLPEYRQENGLTIVPLQFAPRQSEFVVFQERSQPSPVSHPHPGKNFPELTPVQEIAGEWEVRFEPQWFYPDNGTNGTLRFDRLVDWTKRPEAAVEHYSGSATYLKVFDLSSLHPLKRLFLDLGVVKNIARVSLNGHDLGILWTAPWRVEIDQVVKDKRNVLQVEVINLWPNRLIGDSALLPEKGRTVTNITNFTSDAPLMESGLLGPVTLHCAE